MPLQVDFRRRVLKGGATGAGLPAFDTHPSPSAQLRNKGVWCVQVDASAEHRRTGTQHGRERRPLTTNAAAERPAERRRLCAKRPEARASTSLLRAFRHRPLRLQPSLSPPPSRHGTLSLQSVQQRSSGPKGGADAKTQAPSTTRLRVIRPPVLFFLCRRGTCQEVVRAPYPHPHTAAVSSAGRLSSSQFPGHPSSELRLRHRPSSRLPPSTHDGTRGSRRCLTGDRAKLLVGAC